MKGEIPMFRRCCFVFPLRYGLLMWGYFKLMAGAIIITYLSASMMMTVTDIRGPVTDHVALHRGIYHNMIIPVGTLTVLIADFMATIVFIIGGHQKNVRFIRLFYYMSMAMWVFTSLLITLSVIGFINTFAYFSDQYWLRILMTFLLYFICFAVQTYFIFLVRNQIMKLKSRDGFKNASEAKCALKSDGAGEDTETEDV